MKRNLAIASTKYARCGTAGSLLRLTRFATALLVGACFFGSPDAQATPRVSAGFADVVKKAGKAGKAVGKKVAKAGKRVGKTGKAVGKKVAKATQSAGRQGGKTGKAASKKVTKATKKAVE